MELSFPPNQAIGISSHNTIFREIKQGDMLISSEGIGKILSNSYVIAVNSYSNCMIVSLTNPVKLTSSSRLSFYDPTQYKAGISINGTEEEGFYMNFYENPGKKKKFGIEHEIIKIKNIESINLRLSAHNKIYKI